ncbi:glutamine amidotransferase [soil metagenome]
MKPFLLLATREDDEAADNEFAAFAHFTGLSDGALHRIRLERGALPHIDLDDWSGILLGGGPFQSSDQRAAKPAVQRRIETDLHRLLDDVVARDYPFFGACYGIGTLGTHQGAVVDRLYGELVGSVRIELTDAGCTDPVFGVLPARFAAFVGHKEAVRTLPPHAVRLAGSATCPVQGFRVGTNVYATQFHPELDIEGLCLRIETYRLFGYFDPAEAESLKAMARASSVQHPTKLLRRFVEVYART